VPEILSQTTPQDRPNNFGACWKRPEADLAWYTWMYNGRVEQHLTFQQWFTAADHVEKIETVLELGCGLSVGYADFFSEIAYTGSDLAPQLIDWCRLNRENARHRYLACDFVRDAFPIRYDLVFSHGTIDNNYDMDEFLRAAVRASRRWVYITAYRGFFPNLQAHRIDWRESDGCFYNDLSPVRAAAVLREAGCAEVAVVPSFTGRKEIPYETLIVARVRMPDAGA
jgi:Methyltransferase domain